MTDKQELLKTYLGVTNATVHHENPSHVEGLERVHEKALQDALNAVEEVLSDLVTPNVREQVTAALRGHL